VVDGAYVFHSMGHTRHLRLVTEVPNIDIKRRAGFVRLRIMNKESLQLVGKLDDSILAIVKRWFLKTICEQDSGRGWTRRRGGKRRSSHGERSLGHNLSLIAG
jgi:hypothetical protein